MQNFQIWLVTTLQQETPISRLMMTAWAWPIVESLHFLGLCLLIGAIGTFDLRLLGLARHIPIAAVHRLIPVGLIGFALNIATGTMFVMTEPDQYIYNPSFHMKLVFITIAGLNAGMFYLTSFRRAFGSTATLDAPKRAKVIAAVSLCSWLLVIVCGRLITFYRPGSCRVHELTAPLICIP
jgi:hypothetical protein